MPDNSSLEVRPQDRFALALIPEAGLGRRFVSFLTSLAIQAIAIAVLVIVPLMATDNMPEVAGVTSLIMTVPAAPAPPPARGPARRSSGSGPRAPNPTPVATFAAPVDIAEFIGDGDLDFDFGVEGGLPAGIPGGVVIGIPPTSPPPPPPEPVRVGGDIQPPRRIHYVEPRYPEIARQARVEGLVILEAVIDVSGNVSGLRTLRSAALLDAAAIEAVRQWRYEPTLLNGTPVPIVMTVTVRFELPRAPR